MQKGITSTVILIIFLLGFFFYLGTKYEKSKTEKVNIEQKLTTINPTPTIKEDLEERCGSFPLEAYPQGSANWIDISGPVWSPDCRFAASTATIVGRGGGPISDVGEGVYLYTDATKMLRIISKSNSAYFEGWTDRYNFRFRINDKKYNYSIIESQITPLNR